MGWLGRRDESTPNGVSGPPLHPSLQPNCVECEWGDAHTQEIGIKSLPHWPIILQLWQPIRMQLPADTNHILSPPET